MSAVPHSNHLTVETADWQNRDSTPQQSDIILHCHVCLGLPTPYIFPHGGGNKFLAKYISCFDVYSFVIEGHLVEWLFQLKVYTSLNIV